MDSNFDFLNANRLTAKESSAGNVEEAENSGLCTAPSPTPILLIGSECICGLLLYIFVNLIPIDV